MDTRVREQHLSEERDNAQQFADKSFSARADDFFRFLSDQPDLLELQDER